MIDTTRAEDSFIFQTQAQRLCVVISTIDTAGRSVGGVGNRQIFVFESQACFKIDEIVVDRIIGIGRIGGGVACVAIDKNVAPAWIEGIIGHIFFWDLVIDHREGQRAVLVELVIRLQQARWHFETRGVLSDAITVFALIAASVSGEGNHIQFVIGRKSKNG